MYLANYFKAFTVHLSLFCTPKTEACCSLHFMTRRQTKAWEQLWFAGPVIGWLWEHDTVVHTVIVDSHTSLPPPPPPPPLPPPLSRYGKALRLQPLWASSQPAATTPIHNRRIEGSPKLKALLSLRLVAMERRSDRLISLWHPGWPWLWPPVRAPLQTHYSELLSRTFWDQSLSAEPQTRSLAETSRLLLDVSLCHRFFCNSSVFPLFFPPPNSDWDPKCPCEWIWI